MTEHLQRDATRVFGAASTYHVGTKIIVIVITIIIIIVHYCRERRYCQHYFIHTKNMRDDAPLRSYNRQSSADNTFSLANIKTKQNKKRSNKAAYVVTETTARTTRTTTRTASCRTSCARSWLSAPLITAADMGPAISGTPSVLPCSVTLMLRTLTRRGSTQAATATIAALSVHSRPRVYSMLCISQQLVFTINACYSSSF